LESPKHQRKLLSACGKRSFPILVLTCSHDALETDVWSLEQILKIEEAALQRQREHVKSMMPNFDEIPARKSQRLVCAISGYLYLLGILIVPISWFFGSSQPFWNQRRTLDANNDIIDKS